MAERLGVFFGDLPVGTLECQPDGRLAFEYARGWLLDPSSFPISASVPLAPGWASGWAAHAFFANLLPEGQVREAVARRLGLSVSNDFGLLKALGGECAGALAILPESEIPNLAQGSYEPLPDASLAGMARRFDVLAEVTGGRGLRLSLAGAQDKLPVYRDPAGLLCLPMHGAPSTHILKVPSRRFKHLPANELLTTRLARALSLSTVEMELLPVEGVELLLVRRYDRLVADGVVRRLHQEDVCQALGLMPGTKYEQEGGPAFADALRVVRERSTEPLVDVQQLLRWIIFGLLAGNADGHGKNLSLLYESRSRARLAPFYDLVCTRAYPSLDRHLAMGIGEQRDPARIGRNEWQRLAAGAGVGPRLVLSEVERLATELPAAFEAVAANHLAVHGETPAVQHLRRVIARQCRCALGLLPG